MENATTNNVINDTRCVKCFLRTYERLFQKFNVSERNQQIFMQYFDETVLRLKHLSAPEVQRELSLKFCELIGVEDPFFEEKRDSNIQALKIFDRWQPEVFKSVDSFQTTLRLAIAGNIMDYGASDYFDLDDVVIKVLHSDFAIDDSNLLRDKIEQATNILYLGDNAGEIVFDRLFIETNMSDKVTFVVKGGPILNDVTAMDAEEVVMGKSAEIITNGYDAPSTILNKSSQEFLDAYNSADLIISKGQGNLEGLLYENNEKIFFLLMVKCDVIADLLKVEKGSFIVYNGGNKIEEQEN